MLKILKHQGSYITCLGQSSASHRLQSGSLHSVILPQQLQKKGTTTGCSSACAAEKHHHCLCLLQIRQNNCKQRVFNPRSEMPSLLVRLFSGAKCYCSKDKAYFIFLPRQLPSNRDFWNILQLVSQTSGARAGTDSAIQKKSEKDRQHFKINQLHLLAPFADVLGKEGRKKEKRGRGFQH